jgi:hypothetical protein
MLTGIEMVPWLSAEEETYRPPDATGSDARVMGDVNVPASASRRTKSDGGGTTATVKLRLTLWFGLCPSLTVTVMVALPVAFSAGVRRNEPLESGLAYVTTGWGIRPGLLDVAVTVKAWISCAAPELMPVRETTRGPTFGFNVKLPSGFSVGGEFWVPPAGGTKLELLVT